MRNLILLFLLLAFVNQEASAKRTIKCSKGDKLRSRGLTHALSLGLEHRGGFIEKVWPVTTLAKKKGVAQKTNLPVSKNGYKWLLIDNRLKTNVPKDKQMVYITINGKKRKFSKVIRIDTVKAYRIYVKASDNAVLNVNGRTCFRGAWGEQY